MTVVVTNDEGVAVDVRSNGHVVRVDEPEPIGTGTGPDPYDLLLGALGACTAITVRLYATRKEWPLRRVTVTLAHSRSHGTDCADGASRCERVMRRVELDGDLTAEQHARLQEIATRCPVARTLGAAVEIEGE